MANDDQPPTPEATAGVPAAGVPASGAPGPAPTAETPAVPPYGTPPGAPPPNPYPYPYPYGPPPAGGSQPPRQVTFGRTAALLLGAALLMAGIGAGIGIGSGIWSTSAPAANRFPVIPSPTGAHRYFGTGRYGPGRSGTSRPSTGPSGKGRSGTGGTGPGPAPGGRAGFGLGGFGGATGQVTAVSGTSLTVKEADGATVTVDVPSSTAINVVTAGSKSNLTSGSCVEIRASPSSTRSSSSVTAGEVEVLPASDCSGSSS